jgi:hypothetical protein
MEGVSHPVCDYRLAKLLTSCFTLFLDVLLSSSHNSKRSMLMTAVCLVDRTRSPSIHQIVQHGLCVDVDMHGRSSSTIPTLWWQDIHADEGRVPFDQALQHFHSTNNTLAQVL